MCIRDREKLCPVLSYFIEDDWMHACEKCIELLLSERHGHTLVIHSNDRDVIHQFAIKKPVGRMLVNTPAVYGSMGATTNLFPAMTLGSGSAGKDVYKRQSRYSGKQRKKRSAHRTGVCGRRERAEPQRVYKDHGSFPAGPWG